MRFPGQVADLEIFTTVYILLFFSLFPFCSLVTISLSCMDLLLILGVKFFSRAWGCIGNGVQTGLLFLWVFSNNAMPSSSGSTWSRHLLGTTSRVCCASL